MSDHLPPWARRSLSAPLDAEIVERGEPAIARALAASWEAARREPDDRFTHGFHTWPARMHPTMARELIRLVTRGAAPRTVLDPFAGGGTVLLEARLFGHQAVGVDLNPLSARVARVRAEPPPTAVREQHALGPVLHRVGEGVVGQAVDEGGELAAEGHEVLLDGPFGQSRPSGRVCRGVAGGLPFVAAGVKLCR